MVDNTHKVQCAHCGFKQPRAVQLKDGTERWIILCNCGISTKPHKTLERAWKQWNTRVVAK